MNCMNFLIVKSSCMHEVINTTFAFMSFQLVVSVSSQNAYGYVAGARWTTLIAPDWTQVCGDAKCVIGAWLYPVYKCYELVR